MDDPTNIAELIEIVKSGGWTAVLYLLWFVYKKYVAEKTKTQEKVDQMVQDRIKDIKGERDRAIEEKNYIKKEMHGDLREVLEHLRKGTKNEE